MFRYERCVVYGLFIFFSFVFVIIIIIAFAVVVAVADAAAAVALFVSLFEMLCPDEMCNAGEQKNIV